MNSATSIRDAQSTKFLTLQATHQTQTQPTKDSAYDWLLPLSSGESHGAFLHQSHKVWRTPSVRVSRRSTVAPAVSHASRQDLYNSRSHRNLNGRRFTSLRRCVLAPEVASSRPQPVGDSEICPWNNPVFSSVFGLPSFYLGKSCSTAPSPGVFNG